MNPIRRYILYRWNSRHNPLTRIASICILLAIATGALGAVLELAELQQVNAADKEMIEELTAVMEGKADMVERAVGYEVRYPVNKTTYEVR